MTGLGVAQQMGFSVPDDVSIVSWDDSLLCRFVHPPLTTLSRDIAAYGARASERLLALIDDPDDRQTRRDAARRAHSALEHRAGARRTGAAAGAVEQPRALASRGGRRPLTRLTDT